MTINDNIETLCISCKRDAKGHYNFQLASHKREWLCFDCYDRVIRRRLNEGQDVCHCGLGESDHRHGGAAEHSFTPVNKEDAE